MKIRYFFWGFWCLLVGCATAPEPLPAKHQRVIELTQTLQRLSPTLSSRDARRFSEVAVNEAAHLRQQYDVTLTPWFHNVQVYWGAKNKGYCYHYARDLYDALIRLNIRQLDLYFVRANDGEWLEHNAIVVAPIGQSWQQGWILDGWRDAGVLFFAPVSVDQKDYDWQLSGRPSAP